MTKSTRMPFAFGGIWWKYVFIFGRSLTLRFSTFANKNDSFCVYFGREPYARADTRRMNEDGFNGIVCDILGSWFFIYMFSPHSPVMRSSNVWHSVLRAVKTNESDSNLENAFNVAINSKISYSYTLERPYRYENTCNTKFIRFCSGLICDYFLFHYFNRHGLAHRNSGETTIEMIDVVRNQQAPCDSN